jgi:hypothetical protein
MLGGCFLCVLLLALLPNAIKELLAALVKRYTVISKGYKSGKLCTTLPFNLASAYRYAEMYL